MTSPTAAPGRRPTRSAVDTRARILAAATAEFAERGLAGGRVDRIAAAADANKERIYAYFGSKEGLFDEAVRAIIGELLDLVPFDALDLPGYAVRLYDFTLSHPNLVRLGLWYSLERPSSLEDLPQAKASTARKVEALVAAQRVGAVSDSIDPQRLIPLLLGMAQGGILLGPTPVDADEVTGRREALRVAVARLIEPDG
ncbi:TetR family transcriptional regulator [Nakamurella sp.]|uniref:TetR family transcriptional regulator n=1 Tax=Nakamurella sp. TaxID=1869182 RepID=UPI003783BF51